MEYKGYKGVAEFDEETKVIFGHVVGLRDVVTFQAESATEIEQAFHDSVDDYLEFCASRGESPEKPYSGNFMVRLESRLHRALANAAEEQGVSLNALVESTLAETFLPDTVNAKRVSKAAPPTWLGKAKVGIGQQKTAAKVSLRRLNLPRRPKHK